jgi:hypothetical protein
VQQPRLASATPTQARPRRAKGCVARASSLHCGWLLPAGSRLRTCLLRLDSDQVAAQQDFVALCRS